jgi:hypothetical protein
MIAELMDYLGAASEKAETQDYIEIVEDFLNKN